MPSAASQSGSLGNSEGFPLEDSTPRSPEDSDAAPQSQEQENHPKTSGEYISYVHVFHSLEV